MMLLSLSAPVAFLSLLPPYTSLLLPPPSVRALMCVVAVTLHLRPTSTCWDPPLPSIPSKFQCLYHRSNACVLVGERGEGVGEKVVWGWEKTGGSSSSFVCVSPHTRRNLSSLPSLPHLRCLPTHPHPPSSSSPVTRHYKTRTDYLYSTCPSLFCFSSMCVCVYFLCMFVGLLVSA